MSNIILSICIPTYNRAPYLRETLNSIVCQEIFINTSLVEIVISDNCSTDNTADVVYEFIKGFPDKILYSRNDTNIHDKNMEIVLSKAKGKFLKLNNDTLKHKSTTLDTIISDIENNEKDLSVLFYYNQSINKKPSFYCNDLNDFVQHISYYSTWIGSFGIWRKDFLAIKDFSRYAKLQLTQTDVLHRIIGRGRKVYVNNNSIFNPLNVGSKGGYDTLTVFLDNYTFILRESLSKNYISDYVYVKEIKKILIKFICPSLVKIVVYPRDFKFSAQSKFKRIIKFYKNYRGTLLAFFINYYLLMAYTLIKKMILGYPKTNV